MLLLSCRTAAFPDSIVVHYSSGRFDQAIRLALPQKPENIDPVSAYAAGRSLFERQRHEEAIPFLARSLQQGSLPGRDHALDTLSRSLATVNRDGEAIPWLKELTEQHRDSAFRAAAIPRLAAAMEKTGENSEAIRLYRLALESGQAGNRLSWWNSIAQLAEATGDSKTAVTASLQVISGESYGSANLEALSRLEKLLEPLSNQAPERRLLLCRALLRADRDEQARELFATIKNGADPLHTALLEAWILRRQKRFEQAIPILQRALALPGVSPANQARILENLCHTEISRKQPLTALAHADARYRIGASGALPLYRALIGSVEAPSSEAYRFTLHAARRFPNDSELSGLLLRHIARDLVHRRHRQAISRSRECLTFNKLESDRAGLFYYLGTALQATGDSGGAAAARRDAILVQPFGFYHHLIERDRLPVAAWQLPANPTLSQLCRAWILATPAGQSALEKRIKAEGARSPLRTLKQTAWDEPQTGSGLLAAPVGQRFSILWKNGLFREAWNELALRGVPGRTDHPARRHYWFARFAEKAGLSRQAIFHLRRCLQTSGFGIEAAVLEKLMPGTILRDLYPRPFRALTENPGSRTPVPPLLIEALMRQESAFDANAVSWAGAVGLMQLMPGTAREIAERLNIKVNLFDPADNVRLGTSYLAWVLSLYDEPAPGLAAYNAGPGRITRWRRQLIADHGSYRTDLFTELLPLAESRGYIKIVLSNLMVYTLLYQ